MKKLILAMSLVLSSVVFAEDVTIKLGTLAPQGSSWHTLLKQLAEKWTEASGGKVKLKIYAGGTQGSEGDMVRKMGIGQLQAASMTNIGLHDIASESMVFSVPGMVDEGTFRAIFPKLQVNLEKKFEAKGYVVLSWAQVGTVSIFCTKPYTTLEAAADAKFFAWDGDPGALDAFKLVGVKPVVLASVDIIPSMQTGMINCVSQPAAYVMTARVFEKANKMMDFPWSYLVGATVIKKETWEKIPADLRPKLQALSNEVGAKIDTEVKKLNDDAVTAMKKQGLEVVKVDAPAWERAAMRSWPAFSGKSIPKEFFDEVVKYRDEYRKSKK
jgi:TRAP-type transport system periplasmic protein